MDLNAAQFHVLLPTLPQCWQFQDYRSHEVEFQGRRYVYMIANQERDEQNWNGPLTNDALLRNHIQFKFWICSLQVRVSEHVASTFSTHGRADVELDDAGWTMLHGCRGWRCNVDSLKAYLLASLICINESRPNVQNSVALESPATYPIHDRPCLPVEWLCDHSSLQEDSSNRLERISANLKKEK